MSIRQPDMDENVRLAARLLELRVEAGLTQADFGALGGTTGKTQYRYEDGQPPKLDYLMRLAENGIDAGYVVTGRRSDGVVHPLEISFLNDFRRLDDGNKEDLMFLTAAMLKNQGKEIGDEAKLASRIVAALVDYQSLSVTEWVADLKKNAQSQNQTVHSPKVEFRAKPKDEG